MTRRGHSRLVGSVRAICRIVVAVGAALTFSAQATTAANVAEVEPNDSFGKLLSKLACALTSIVTLIASAAASVRTVALTGQVAPGTPPAITFTTLGSSGLNSAGDTVFIASLRGVGVDSTNDRGVWSEGSGSLALVARTGNQAPGTPDGVKFAFFFNAPVLNDPGRVALSAFLTGPGVNDTNDQGIWSESSGALSLIMREGEHAPGMPVGVNFSAFQNLGDLVFNDANQVAIVARLNGPGVVDGNDEGVWSQGSGSLSVVAREGSHAPGTSDGANFASFFFLTALNNAGQVAFSASLSGAGVDNSNDAGIWSEGAGGLTLVARKGSPAPGTPDGINFGAIFTADINGSGKTAFNAALAGAGLSGDNFGVWSEASGSLTLSARTGDAAPGTSDGTNFGQFFPPRINDIGHVVFHASLTGPAVNSTDDSSLWLDGPAGVSLVAREGNHAPGTPVGVNFAGQIGNYSLTEIGQIAFDGGLTGAGVSTANDRGVWATDRNNILHLIAREGDPFEVAPGDVRTISAASFPSFTGNADGRRSQINSSGQILLRLSFTDGSTGEFVSNLVAVPEPAAGILMLIAFTASVHQCRGVTGQNPPSRCPLARAAVYTPPYLFSCRIDLRRSSPQLRIEGLR